jgi:hypothetical protein
MYVTTSFRVGFRSLALVAAALLAAASPLLPGPDKEAAATCTTAKGVLMAKTGAGWRAVRSGQPVPVETPLVSLFDSTLRSANGAVELRLAADPTECGPLPILESRVVVHPAGKHDLAFTPVGGLMVLTNTKKQGPATVRVMMREDPVEITLKEPGAKLALEIYSRHAPGAPNLEDPKQDDPVMHVFCIALEGEVFLQGKERSVTLHAPPGPAVLVWDSLVREPEVQRLEQLPPECTLLKEKGQKPMDAMCKWAAKLADESPETVRREGANSKVALERKAAVIAMGALDDLPGLSTVLTSSKYPDARDQAVLALRHWLGRAPGQTAKLDAGLRKHGLSEVQSQNVLHLLYGFTPEQKRDPATYDFLIEDLKNSRPGVRELAHWHLVRLAPAGKAFAFDAQAPEAERLRGYEQWRKLIPPGKLPPPPAK